MASAKTRAAVPPHGVNFIDEDDTRRVLFALNEEIAHSGSADADEHFDEVGTADTEKRHPCFAGDGASQQSFTRPWRTHKKTTLGNSAAEFGKLFGVFQKGNDLLEIVLRFLHAGHIGKRYFVLVLGQQLRPALAERHGLAAAYLHLAHKENPHADQQQHGKPVEQQDHVPRRFILGLCRDLDALIPQRLDQLRVVRRKSSKTFAVLVFALDIMSLDHDLLHIAAIHRAHELAEDNFRFAPVLLAKNAENNEENQR